MSDMFRNARRLLSRITPVRVPGPDSVEILITSSGNRDDVVHTGTGLRADGDGARAPPRPSR